MHLGRLRARKLRGWVVLPLLPLLALRLLVPEGFMPRFGDHHAVSMQMCHGDGRSSAAMRLLGDAPTAPGDRTSRHEAPCVFAAAGAVAPPAPPPLVAGSGVAPLEPPLPAVATPALRLQHRTQSPRAPPTPV